jgi:hypothetical protein
MMNTLVRPIETRYAGYRFRSRLEARWAVFFAAAGIEYRYEAEGFNVGGTYYLPDFWLPQLKAFVEVKPTEAAAEQAKPVLAALVKQVGDRGILISGPPNLIEPPSIIGVDRHGHWWNPAWWLQCSFCDRVSIASGKSCDVGGANRLPHRARSSRAWLRRKPQSPGHKPYWREYAQ